MHATLSTRDAGVVVDGGDCAMRHAGFVFHECGAGNLVHAARGGERLRGERIARVGGGDSVDDEGIAINAGLNGADGDLPDALVAFDHGYAAHVFIRFLGSDAGGGLGPSACNFTSVALGAQIRKRTWRSGCTSTDLSVSLGVGAGI